MSPGDGRTRDGEDKKEERPSREDRPGRGRGKGRGGAKQDRPQPPWEPKKLEEEAPVRIALVAMLLQGCSTITIL